MFKLPQEFWGKLKKAENGSIIEWHSLLGHSLDVSLCVEALLNHTILNKRIASYFCQKTLTPSQIARLSSLAALHDIGKFNIGFQSKASIETKSDWEGHQKPVLSLLSQKSDESQAVFKALQILETYYKWADNPDNFCGLFIACICHHGKPLSTQHPHNPKLWKPKGHLNPISGLCQLQDNIREWFPEAFSSDADPIPSSPEFQHAFAGLITFADWLGSSTEFFRFDNGYSKERLLTSRKQANRILDSMFLNPWKAREGLDFNHKTFSDIFGFTPRACQGMISALPVPEKGSLTILESETGTGKTEAALFRFLNLFNAGAVDGLYFALPTRTAATQIYRRILRTIAKAFPKEDSRPPVLLAVPGYIETDGHQGTRILSNFEVLWDDDPKEGERYKRWASEHPKRFLSGCIVIGTIDQVLLASLQVKHAHMRSACLSRQLIVVDEVHASDAYMNKLLENVLEKHIKAGGHAFLMSATLGSKSHIEFSSCIISKRTLSSLDSSCNIPYPLITHFELEKSPLNIAVESNSPEREIQIELKNIISDVDCIADIAIKAAQHGGKVLLIRNTVGDAIQTQLAIESKLIESNRHLIFLCNQIPTLHHSRFAKEDREALDHAIEFDFGKARDPGGKIIVATQTVQQSLDLDADLLITDLCPMDIILQRIGRLHRHQRPTSERPTDFRSPKAIILTYKDSDMGSFINNKGEAIGPHGFGTVYENLGILQATYDTLARYKVIKIPSMNRELVEHSIHPIGLDEVADLHKGNWKSHLNDITGKLQGRKLHAGMNVIDYSTPFEDERCLFPDTNQKIKTRLGEGDRIITFQNSLLSPFGNKITAISIPSWFLNGISSDEEIQNLESENGIIKFTLGAKTFLYDRLGLRFEKAPSNNEDKCVEA